MKGQDLDLFLSMGYFRMHQNVFTCNFLVFEEKLYPVHWLRVDLERVAFGKTQRQLLNRTARFSFEAKPFQLTDEIKALHARYRQHIDFDAPVSIEESLYSGPLFTEFDTWGLEIRDQERLIAVGIFDRGNHTIAGIMNVYDPEYRRYSLGKVLMLKKIEFAQQQGLTYYYPGYIVSGMPKFDYKVTAAESATELLDAAYDDWIPFSWETTKNIADEMLRNSGQAR
ncbi:GNAT family N-acetyltransferase [Fibrella sp. WM1]|uniref:GNAT family N-acetyltransferase n=1 Tax=Fibrella musci TaxID=3242485 RepID=UPI00352002CC